MKEKKVKYPIQLQFFEKLRQLDAENTSQVNDIADILEISTHAAYRRMRGESILGMDEMVKLCRYYKISSCAAFIENGGT